MRCRALAAVLFLTSTLCACGRTPTRPTPGDTDRGAPTNAPPVIDRILVQGSRANEPQNFADVAEAVQVIASVHDEETPADRLQYQWSSSVGSFGGSGNTVTWTAPLIVAASREVELTLKVVETVAPGRQNTAVGTAVVQLHESAKEVGEMSRQFLIDFSDTAHGTLENTMRNFSQLRCPQPSEIESERNDVADQYAYRSVQEFRIGTPALTIAFGGSCPVVPGHAVTLGDACAVVPAYWESIDLRTGARGAVDGDDIIAAAYSPADNRWWLCASHYRGRDASGPKGVWDGQR